jgi:hypothetical protein
MEVIMDAKKLYSPDFKEEWENTEVGQKIKTHAAKVQAWHEAEVKEKYKDIKE